MRRTVRAALALLGLVVLALPAAAAPDAAFTKFLQSLWPDAKELGVTRPVFDAAFAGLEPDLSLPDLALPGRDQTPVWPAARTQMSARPP